MKTRYNFFILLLLFAKMSVWWYKNTIHTYSRSNNNHKRHSQTIFFSLDCKSAFDLSSDQFQTKSNRRRDWCKIKSWNRISFIYLMCLDVYCCIHIHCVYMAWRNCYEKLNIFSVVGNILKFGQLECLQTFSILPTFNQIYWNFFLLSLIDGGIRLIESCFGKKSLFYFVWKKKPTKFIILMICTVS